MLHENLSLIIASDKGATPLTKQLTERVNELFKKRTDLFVAGCSGRINKAQRETRVIWDEHGSSIVVHETVLNLSMWYDDNCFFNGDIVITKDNVISEEALNSFLLKSILSNTFNYDNLIVNADLLKLRQEISKSHGQELQARQEYNKALSRFQEALQNIK